MNDLWSLRLQDVLQHLEFIKNSENCCYGSKSSRSIISWGISVDKNKLFQFTINSLKTISGELMEFRFCLRLLIDLLKRTLSSQIPILSAVRGLTIANQIANAILKCSQSNSLKHPFRWTDGDVVLDIVRTRLLTHKTLLYLQQYPIDLSALSRAVLDCFLCGMSVHDMSADQLAATGGLSLMFHRVSGPSSGCWLLRDAVAMGIPADSLGRHSQAPQSDLVVALFDCSLELPENHAEMQIVFEVASSAPRVSMELVQLDRFADLLLSCGVTFVGCQRRVHPHLVKALRRRGVACLSRVSVRFMLALQRLSGARQLGTFPIMEPTASATIIDPASLGRLSSLQREVLFGKSFVVARRQRPTSANDQQSHSSSSSFSTVLITAESDHLAVALQEAVQDTHLALWRLTQDPWVLPGRGQWQATVAAQILEHASCVTKVSSVGQLSTQKAVRLYAECLHRSSQCDEAVGQLSSVCSYASNVKALNVALNIVVTLLDLDSETEMEPEETCF